MNNIIAVIKDIMAQIFMWVVDAFGDIPRNTFSESHNINAFINNNTAAMNNIIATNSKLIIVVNVCFFN